MKMVDLIMCLAIKLVLFCIQMEIALLTTLKMAKNLDNWSNMLLIQLLLKMEESLYWTR